MLKYAYKLVNPYRNHSPLINLLTNIMCNNSFGDVISALQLVYGHIYAFNVTLGTHKIDNDLLIYTKFRLGKIVEFLSVVENNGAPLNMQVTEENYLELSKQFIYLKKTVEEYLSKPGTEIR